MAAVERRILAEREERLSVSGKAIEWQPVQGTKAEIEARAAARGRTMAERKRVEAEARAEALVAGMTPMRRAIHELRKEGLSSKEIAARLGIAEGTVHSHERKAAP